MRAAPRAGRGPDGYRHEALFYGTHDDFMEGTLEFIRGGVAAREPTLVVLPPAKIDALRGELDGAREVMFADMVEIGANPARIIPAWQEFVDRHSRPGRRLRGVGEPVWATRSPAEVAECHHHEALLNLVFDRHELWLLCPYDTATLDDDILDEARRNHPFVRVARGSVLPSTFPGLEALAAPFDEPLPDPAAVVTELAFDAHSISEVRALVARRAAEAGLSPRRVDDLVLSAHELAANSIRHGGGRGTLRIWAETDTMFCEVRDAGHLADPLLDRTRPSPDSECGRGLWLANHLCDLVQLRSLPWGTLVRLHVRAR